MFDHKKEIKDNEYDVQMRQLNQNYLNAYNILRAQVREVICCVNTLPLYEEGVFKEIAEEHIEDEKNILSQRIATYNMACSQFLSYGIDNEDKLTTTKTWVRKKTQSSFDVIKDAYKAFYRGEIF